MIRKAANEGCFNCEHKALSVNKHLTLLGVVLGLFIGVLSAEAQTTINLGQKIVPLGGADYAATRNKGTSAIMQIKSSNPGVAIARLYDANTIQIVPVALGKTTVQFWDNAERLMYTVLVWVVKPGTVPNPNSNPNSKGNPKPDPDQEPDPNPNPNPNPNPPEPGSTPKPNPNSVTGKIDRCLVGTWETVQVSGNGATGGAGFRLKFKGDGTQIADYRSMQPLTVVGMGGYTYYYDGVSEGRIKTENSDARIETVEKPGATIATGLAGLPKGIPKPLTTMGPVALGGNRSNNHYSCRSNTLEFTTEDLRGQPYLQIRMKRVDDIPENEEEPNFIGDKPKPPKKDDKPKEICEKCNPPLYNQSNVEQDKNGDFIALKEHTSGGVTYKKGDKVPKDKITLVVCGECEKCNGRNCSCQLFETLPKDDKHPNPNSQKVANQNAGKAYVAGATYECKCGKN